MPPKRKQESEFAPLVWRESATESQNQHSILFRLIELSRPFHGGDTVDTVRVLKERLDEIVARGDDLAETLDFFGLREATSSAAKKFKSRSVAPSMVSTARDVGEASVKRFTGGGGGMAHMIDDGLPLGATAQTFRARGKACICLKYDILAQLSKPSGIRLLEQLKVRWSVDPIPPGAQYPIIAQFAVRFPNEVPAYRLVLGWIIGEDEKAGPQRYRAQRFCDEPLTWGSQPSGAQHSAGCANPEHHPIRWIIDTDGLPMSFGRLFGDSGSMLRSSLETAADLMLSDESDTESPELEPSLAPNKTNQPLERAIRDIRMATVEKKIEDAIGQLPRIHREQTVVTAKDRDRAVRQQQLALPSTSAGVVEEWLADPCRRQPMQPQKPSYYVKPVGEPVLSGVAKKKKHPTHQLEEKVPVQNDDVGLGVSGLEVSSSSDSTESMADALLQYIVTFEDE